MPTRDCVNYSCSKNFNGHCQANIECLVMCEDYEINWETATII